MMLYGNACGTTSEIIRPRVCRWNVHEPHPTVLVACNMYQILFPLNMFINLTYSEFQSKYYSNN